MVDLTFPPPKALSVPKQYYFIDDWWDGAEGEEGSDNVNKTVMF